MLLAVLSVSALIWLVLGRREAAVVLIAIPVTLALTLFTFYLYGYTLNRITLFALIFSIGILVDDAIVVVENIVRHARMRGEERGGLAAIAIRAIDEVGNPTILATLAVVAAILPMAFIRGLSGPYMRPIPVGASAAMVFSLVVAFVVTPWAAVRLLKPSAHLDHGDEDRPHADLSARDGAAHRQRQESRDLPGGRGGLAAGGRRAGPARTGDGEDDAVRQQERVPGHDRHARGHGARDDGARRVGTGVSHSGGRDGRQRPAVRGCVGALQLQRPRAALFSEARSAPCRSPGEPRAEGRTLGTEPRRRRTRARAAGSGREAVRRDHPGGGGATGPARAANPRRGSLWAGSGAAEGGGRAHQIDLRAHPRRGRYRLVRRSPACEDHARRRRRKSRGCWPVAGGRGGGRTNGRLGRIRGPAARRTGARGRADHHPPPPQRSQSRGRPVDPASRHQAGRRGRTHERRDHAGRGKPVSQESAGGDVRHR